jgi:hypothetical protein
VSIDRLGETQPVKPASTLEGVLLDEHLVDEAALRQARRVALRRRLPLLEVLVEEHLVDDGRVADALARSLRLPRVQLATLTLDDEALREVPHDLALAHLVLPVGLDSDPERDLVRRTLRLAMANPLDPFALDDIGHSSGCVVEPVVASVSEIRDAIQRSYRGFVTKMIPRLTNEERRPTEGASTQPHMQLPDERSVEVRLVALINLLVDRGVLTREALDEQIQKLVKGEDV